MQPHFKLLFQIVNTKVVRILMQRYRLLKPFLLCSDYQWTLIFNSVPWKQLFPYSVIYVLYAIYDILRHSLKKGRDHLILHTFVFICIKLCLHSVLPTYLRKCSDFFMIHNLFMEILKNASFWPKNCKSWRHWHLRTYHDATPYHDKEIYDKWVSPLGGKELNLAPFVPFHGQGVAASVF